jgi:DNA-binding response OmpR family regulator
MEKLSDMRILVLAHKGSSSQVLRTVFSVAGFGHVVCLHEPRRAVELLCAEHFHAVFVEGTMEHEGTPFALAARRLPALRNPMIPMFAVFPLARKCDVEAARDLGAHGVICRPVSPKTVMAKLRAVLDAPRPFIVAPSFFGPDRRAKSRAGHDPGQERRTRTARKTKVSVAPV